MRLALSLLALAWLLPAALFLCWTFREIRQDYRESRAENAEMREHERKIAALAATVWIEPRNGRSS